MSIHASLLMATLTLAGGPEFLMEKNLAQFPRGVAALDFSPDGKMLAIAADKTVYIYSPRTYKKLRELSLPASAQSIQFHPNGLCLACGYKGGVQVWSVPAWESVRNLTSTGTPHLEFSHSGDQLTLVYTGIALGHETFAILELWDTRRWQKQLSVRGHSSFPLCLAVSPDDKRLATAASDGCAMIWDAKTGKQLHKLDHGRDEYVSAIAFLPDGKRLVTSATQTRVWDIATGKQLRHIGRSGRSIAVVSNSIVLVGGWLLDVDREQPILGEKLFGGARRVAWQPKSGLLATTSKGGQVVLWRWDDGKKK